MPSQMTSTSKTTQTALAAILARLEVGPVVPQVVVADNDYPPLPPTGATSKRKTVATKPNPTTTTTATTTTTTTTTDQPSKDTRFADAVKRRPTHQQLVERQPEFRKAGAAAWLALKRETSVPAHSAPKVELSSGLRLIYASGFPTLSLATFERQCRVPASVPVRPSKPGFLAPKQQTRISSLLSLSFAAKTVTTIQRSPDVKARNFFRSLLASIGGKTLEAATAEAAKIRVQTPDFSISTLETVPKESLPVKKATDKEPAAPAVDSPSDMAAEITPAIQVDGVTPTVTPIADIEMSQTSTDPSQTPNPYTPASPLHPTTIPITPTISEIRRQRSKYAFERTFQVWGKSKLACSYVQANHASSAKFLRSPALSTGQAIGVSLLSLARCGGLWDYPRALKAGLLHPTATDPDQLGSPSRCILCHAHLDCKPMAHLVVDCTHPTVVFARVDTQLLQSINDTRVQIFDCTLHTTTTTTTITTTPASPSLSTATINSNPDPIGASAIWDSVNTHTPIDNYQYSLRTTPEFTPSSSSSPSGFPIFSFFQFSPHTRFEPPISVAHSEIPRQVQDTVEENPTASRTTTTDTHTAAISSTPTPTHISHIGSDDILTVLLGGSLPGTNTAGNTEACPGQQWLTGTVEEGNLLCVNQPVAHRLCDFLQISVRVYRAMLWKHHKSNLSHIPDI
ncbi:hypothetical protein BASA62_003627 [Batrachochytrium salamandrivorans]|nr:hypothetical protein BASA62_003627 [Batrachochytrium salamandrivorans]